MTSESNPISLEQRQNSQSNDITVYFIILSEGKEKLNFEDLNFLSEIEPKNIYNNSIEKGKGKSSFLFHQVFKLEIKNKNSFDNKLQYEIGEQSYDILFDVKDNSFIYEVELLKGNKYIDNIIKIKIDQNQIPLHYKLDIFLEALNKNKETNKIELLFEETYELYKAKKRFSLLISLFLKVYKEYQKLCSKLIDTFKEINGKENRDRDKDLIIELDTFNNIYSNGKSLYEKNDYDPVSFYGIIFCYLSYYDKDNFSRIIKDFSVGNAEILYEILITYYLHFKQNPLEQNSKFYNDFVVYVIENKKEYEIFERVLNYIDDIETYLYVINENRIEIFKKYNDLRNEPIELGDELKLIKKEYEE